MIQAICWLVMAYISRGGSRTAATFKMECFGIIVNGWKSLTIVTKRSIFDVAAVLDPPKISTSLVLMLEDYYILKLGCLNCEKKGILETVLL